MSGSGFTSENTATDTPFIARSRSKDASVPRRTNPGVVSGPYTLKEYDEGRLPLYHFDVYRLGSVDELYDIGCEEYLDGRGIVLMEWSSIVPEIVPADRIAVKIEITGADERHITIENCPDEAGFLEEAHEYTCG